jgi:FKBP-type peptidyl-prolyl cis-trans isomerase 2
VNTPPPTDGTDQKAEPKDKGTSKTESAKAPSPDTVEPDDLVMVEYTAKLKDGTLVQTTRQSIAEDEKQSRVTGFGKDNIFGPEPVIAGKEAGFKGVGTTVIGMKKGQSKQVTLAPQEAYGDIDPNKIAEVPRIRSYQKEVTYPAKDFVMQYDKFPRKDDAIDVNPYLEGTVIEVRDKDVLIKLRPKKKKFEETFGEVQVKEKGDTIEIILEPRMGADFQQDKYTGRIVSMDEDGFEVNLNHPLAGKEIVLDLSVTALTKKADIKSQELKWLEDYDAGLKLAKDKDKPMVMVLFSKTCPWCDKLLNETMTDPRITGLNNSYVWVKIDADFQKELAQKYELTSMPLTLLFDSKGDVREKVSGYLNAADLFRKLKSTYGWEVAGK